MAATLSDFNKPDTSGIALSDFIGSPSRPPLMNEATINRTAAHAAVLSDPANIERNYLSISDELRYGASSNTLTNVLGQYDRMDYAGNLATLRNSLADPEIPIDAKTNAVKSFGVVAGGDSINSLYKRVATAASIADSEPDDNDEVEFGRVDTTNDINQIDEYNGWVQQQINRYDDLQNPTTVQTLHDMVELFIPFAEGANVAQVANSMVSEDGSIDAGAVVRSLTLLGEAKGGIRAMMAAMPLDKRKEAAAKLLEYVRNSSGPAGFNPNQIMALDQMNSFLVSGAYSDEQKFMDNFSSVMDATVVLGAGFKFIRGGLGAVTDLARGPKLAMEAVGTAKRYEAAVEAVKGSGVAEAVDNLLSPVDEIIDALPVVDKMNSEEIAQLRKTINDNLAGTEDVSIDNIINGATGLDKGTADEIAQVREALGGIVSKRNTDLQAMVNEDTLKATRGLIADRVIAAINNTGASKMVAAGEDGIASDVFTDIRAIIDKRVTSATVNSRTLGTEVVGDVTDYLSNKGLTEIKAQTGSNIKGFITSSMRESNIRRRYVRTTVSPTSLSQAYKDANAAKARSVNTVITEDISGKSAQIFYGTDRTSAITNDLLPEVAEAGGSVRHKVSMIDESASAPNTGLKADIKDANGRIDLTVAEKTRARDNAKDAWRDVQGMFNRVEMSQIGDTPRGVEFSMVYGPKDGGFSNANQAIAQAQVALRKYGVLDNEIEVLVKDATGDYVPTKDYSKKGNYLIKIKHDYDIAPTDAFGWDHMEGSNLNLFDTVLIGGDGKSGGAAQHLIPAFSSVDKTVFNAGSVVADKAAWVTQRLDGMALDYANKYGKLDKRQKALVSNYIVEANSKGLKFNPLNLKARGFTDGAVETVRSWKTVQDTIHDFENADLNKTLRSQGFERFVDQSGKTDLIVKKMTIAPANPTKVFSPDNGGQIITISKQEIDELYAKGGNLAKTRSPIEFDGDVFDTVVARQDTAGGYTRRIRDEDQTLNYRDGYYTVRYNDPYFITKEIKGKNGEVFTKAIATSGDRVSAERELARLRATDEKGVYTFRPDIKKDPQSYQDMEWSNIVSSGRTSQRVRGQRLANVGQTNPDLNHLHIDTPEESLMKSIRSTSQRVAYRDYIETSKTRWMKQYGHLLEKQQGQVKWPEDVRKIGQGNAEVGLRDLKDARSNWRHIDAMDSGYVNQLDDMSKMFMKNFSDLAGRAGWTHIEKLGRKAEQFNPSNFARKKASRLMLAFNPIRQLVVQSSQAIPTIAFTNPTGIGRVAAQNLLLNYMNRGGDINSFMKSGAQALTGLSIDEAKAMVKAYERSGIKSTTTADTFMRDDAARLVDRGLAAKTSRVLAKPGDLMQKIGYEAGENLLMKNVWLSEYDMLRKSKVKIGPEELENLSARVRNLTGNMNRGGELPYNSNSLSAILQYMQAPHKAFAMVVMGHKGLDTATRIKLGVGYVTTFGLGANWINDQIDRIVPGENPIKDILTGGMFNMVMNKSLSVLFGKDVETDFSDSMRLLAVPNLFDFWNGALDNGISDLVTNSPAGGLVFGDNPKITGLVQSLARPFVVDNNHTQEEFQQIGLEFLNLFSGASNFLKAKYIMEMQRTMSTSGSVIDWHSNNIEAMMKLAGFATIDEVRYYATNERLYQNSGDIVRSDVEHIVDETSKRLALRGIDNHQQDYYIGMMAEAQRVYQGNPFYMKEFMSALTKKQNKGEDALFKTLLAQAGVIDENKMNEIINGAPSSLTQEQIEAIKGTMQSIRESGF